MMNLLQLFVFSLFVTHGFGQHVTYNHMVNATDVQTKEIIALFENYLASNPQNQTSNPYWNTDEQVRHKQFDFLESEFHPSLYMGFPAHVLSIKFKNNLCEIKVQYSSCKSDGSPNILAIVNYHAIKENGKYKLLNALSSNKLDWQCATVGLVDFYFPAYHRFNRDKAEKLNTFVHQICSDFNVRPTPFEYYFARDYDEVQKLKGIDYYMGMGGHSYPRGKASDDKVYCAGLGEYYPHEVFHVQIDKHFPDRHFWASEGIATFLGGSRGKSLHWHIKRTNQFLIEHPGIDLNNMLNLSNMDSQTAYHYVLGGLIAKKMFDRGGWSHLKEFMSSGNTNEDYYRAIENLLNVKQFDLNRYLRNQLAIEANEE